MLQTRVMPSLLLSDGRLVKTVKFKNPVYVGDPVNAIKIYNEKEVDELIVLDISATVEGREPPFSILQELTNECFMPLCYGGGVTNIEQVRKIFGLGVEKVAINSYAPENPAFISEAARIFGSQSIVAAIDVKKGFLGGYQVKTHSGKKTVSKDPAAYAKMLEDAGVGEILLYSIDRDGTWEGFDLELIKIISKAVNVPVIACGGAGSLEHISKAVHEGGASAVALGSMAVFQGKDLGVLINFPKRADLERIFPVNAMQL